MSMSTEEALKYLNQGKEETPVEKTETQTTAEPAKDPEPSTEPKKDEANSEDTSAKTPEDKSDNHQDGDETKSEKSEGSDEPKPSEDKDEKKTTTPEPAKEDKPADQDKPTKKEQRDFAFVRQKAKYKEAKARIAEQQKEIERLKAELENSKGLEAKHFKNEDGTPNPEAFMNYKFRERDIQDQIKNLSNKSAEEQRAMDIELDREITERCFTDKNELERYVQLRDSRGQAFLDALQENDKNGVILSYLDTLQEYPVVLRELMDLEKNPKLLGRLFRSRDPYSLHHSIAMISDEILDNWHKSKEQPAAEPQKNDPAPQPEAKKVPILGKQITSSPSSRENPGSIMQDWATMNNYIKEHPRR